MPLILSFLSSARRGKDCSIFLFRRALNHECKDHASGFVILVVKQIRLSDYNGDHLVCCLSAEDLVVRVIEAEYVHVAYTPLPDSKHPTSDLQGDLRIDGHIYEQNVEAVPLQINCDGEKTKRGDKNLDGIIRIIEGIDSLISKMKSM